MGHVSTGCATINILRLTLRASFRPPDDELPCVVVVKYGEGLMTGWRAYIWKGGEVEEL